MAIIVKPNTFVPGTVIRSAEVNADFDTIYNDYNGNIRNVNIHLTNGKILIGDVTNQAVEADPASSLLTGFTTGSVLFVGPSSTIAEDNPNFFWDNTNNRLGIRTATPAVPLHINSATTTEVRISGTTGGSLQLGATNGYAIVTDGTTLVINRDAPIGTGTTVIAINASGEIRLPDVDPPTANFGNRNSFVKAWAYVDQNQNIIADYNVSSVTRIGGGFYQIFWDRDFSNANYCVVASPAYNSIGVQVPTSISAVPVNAGSASIVFPGGNDFGFNIIAMGDQ